MVEHVANGDTSPSGWFGHPGRVGPTPDGACGRPSPARPGVARQRGGPRLARHRDRGAGASWSCTCVRPCGRSRHPSPVAVVISAVFAPFVLRLRARGRSRTAAAGIVWAAAILVIGGILLVLALAFLPCGRRAGVVDVGRARRRWRLASLSSRSRRGSEAAVRHAIEAVRSAAGVDSRRAGRIRGRGGHGRRSWPRSSCSSSCATATRPGSGRSRSLGDQKRDRITTAGDDALARVGGYLRGTTVLSSLIAVTDYVFMVVLGVPLAVPLAVLAFLAGFIPYFGGIVTTAIILLIT